MGPLLERAQARETLRSRLADARAGAGSLTLVRGGAGTGKTVLLEAVRVDAAELGVEPLLLDDLHRSGRGAEALDDLARGRGVAIVATRWLDGDPAPGEIRLQPLSHAAAAALVRARSTVPVTDAEAQELWEATDGNPLLLCLLARERSWPAVGRMLAARYGRRSPTWRALAALATLDGPATPSDVAAVGRLAAADVAPAIEPLLWDGWLTRTGDALVVRHAAVRHGVDEALSAVERAALHGRAARLPAPSVRHVAGSVPRRDPAVARALAEAADTALAHADPATAERYLRRALAEPPAPGDEPALRRALRRALFYQLDPEGEPRELAAAVAARVPERAAEARDAARAALRQARGDDPEAAWLPCVGAGLGLVYCGEIAEALATMEAFADRSRRAAFAPGLALALAVTALGHLSSGALGPAAERAADATALLARHPGADAGWAFALAAEIALERGDLAEADRLLTAGSARESNSALSAARLDVVRALRCLAAHEYEQALDRLVVLDGAWMAPWCAPWCSWEGHAAEAAAMLGRAAESARWAERYHRRAARIGAPAMLGRAQRIAGRLEAAVDALRDGEARLELARALMALGERQRRSGMRRVARETLSEAHALACECEAAELAAAAAQELELCSSRAGDGALTASERRVAELVASGLSDADVARRLQLREKTVQMHLGRAYRKLRVTSRRELAGALRALDRE